MTTVEAENNINRCQIYGEYKAVGEGLKCIAYAILAIAGAVDRHTISQKEVDDRLFKSCED